MCFFQDGVQYGRRNFFCAYNSVTVNSNVMISVSVPIYQVEALTVQRTASSVDVQLSWTKETSGWSRGECT